MTRDPLSALDPPVVIEPTQAVLASVVWLHGLGADGHDFEPIVPELGEALTRHVRFVFPHAPRRAVTINGGMPMRAWYDIADMELDRRADETGVRESAQILDALVAREGERGVEAEKVVVAGFSQGGAIALHGGLRQQQRLAGVLALSTYLPLGHTLGAEASNANRHVPIFMGHGSQDPVVPLALSEQSRALLSDHGYVVETHTYPMPHSVCAEEVRDIADWLRRVLAAALRRG
ncbi:MAG: alpha/beta fold hydrolase [Chromatiales bacterium]|nr:alpha/beta fold hydrolase [Chromatiales bacterium]